MEHGSTLATEISLELRPQKSLEILLQVLESLFKVLSLHELLHIFTQTWWNSLKSFADFFSCYGWTQVPRKLGVS